MEPIKILHLEDSALDARLVKATLAAAKLSCEIRLVGSERQYIEELRNADLDVILADFNVEDFDGSEALSLAMNLRPDLPFIFVSGSMGEEAAVDTLRSGATDYVLKQNLARLAPSVDRAIREARERQAQRRMQEAVRLSERKYRELFEKTKDAILISSVDGKIIDANPAAAELLGYPLEELLRLESAAILYAKPETRQQVQQTLQRQGFLHSCEIELKRRDGRMLRVLSTVTAERKQNGQVSAYHTICHDITEQRRLEQELQQAQKMEAIGRLAGGVAHDFNNLLTVILGHGNLAASALPRGSPLLLNLQEVERAAERAAGLTRQLLTFSRKQVIQPRLLNLNSIVSNTETMLRRLIGEHVEMVLSLDPELGQINADPIQMEQIILNTAINARDAMVDGGKLIIETCSVAVEVVPPGASAAPGPYALLSVSDTGCGMEPETLSHIFEPFFTTKGEMGTGLGLATVFGIVKQSGGFITADSRAGFGTTFKMYFPRTSDKTEEQARPTSPILPATETVLLVEDDDPLRDLTRAELEHRGYNVLAAANGQEALAVVESYPQRIDLLLTDVIMPGMSGKDVAEEVAKLRPDIVTVYMSGYTDDVIGTHDLRGNEINFVEKPFTLEGLHEKLRESLKSARGPRRRILVVSNDHAACAKLCEDFQRAGHSAFHARNRVEATKMLARLEIDLVAVELAGEFADDVIREIRREWPAVKIVAVSEAAASRDFTLRSYPDLAFAQKPINSSSLLQLLSHAPMEMENGRANH